MQWIIDTPKPGNIIRTKVSFYHHYGIFISEDEIIQFGLPNDPGKPANEIFILSTKVEDFLSAGGEIEVGVPNKAEKDKMRSTKEIIEIARSRIGENGYDILHNNCEHFVNSCVFGESNSNFINSVREKLRRKLKLSDK